MAISQRYLTITNGHMILTGNTLLLAQDSNSNGGAFTTVDTSQVAPGGNPPGTTLNWRLNSSMARLTIPPTATVVYAELTWTSLLVAGAINYSAFGNDPVNFTTPASTTPVQVTLDAADSTINIYTRTADVTALVQAGGSGEYTVGRVAGVNGYESTGITGNAAGWYLTVIVYDPAETSKLFQVNTGNIFVPGSSNITFSIEGFSTPSAGPVSGRLFAGIQRGDPQIDFIDIFTGPDISNFNYQLTRPPMPNNNMIAGFISNTETGAIIDTDGTFGNDNNIPGNPPVAVPFARWHLDIAAFDISPSLTNNQTALVTRSTSGAINAVFAYNVYNVQIEAKAANITTEKSVDLAYAIPGDTLTYTINVTNVGSIDADNVTITDVLPASLQFVPGSITVDNNPIVGDITTGANIGSVSINDTVVVKFLATVIDTPDPNTIENVANTDYTFAPLPGQPPISGSTVSNPVTTIINFADIAIEKIADPENSDINGVITYTLIVTNNGNTSANNVVITDPIPAGTSYVPGSVTGAVPFTGDPTTVINLNTPLFPGDTATFSWQVQFGDIIPIPNPILNTAKVNYLYTIDPANENGAAGIVDSNTVSTQVSNATLTMTKKVDKSISYLDDIITYSFVIKNSGNVPANNVIINDLPANGTVYVPGSLIMNVPFTGDPSVGIVLTNPIMPDEIVTLSFQVQVTEAPNPNPVINLATVNYEYIVDPQSTIPVFASANSNSVTTYVFRYNYAQQINDLIESVSLEEAALAAIINAEGAKIQRIVAMKNVSPQELLCLNKSVSELLELISSLQAILRQKINTVKCQINGPC